MNKKTKILLTSMQRNLDGIEKAIKDKRPSSIIRSKCIRQAKYAGVIFKKFK